MITAAVIIAATIATTYGTIHTAVAAVPLRQGAEIKEVPIATSGNNVYVVWPSNKTTSDFEVMFKASTDGGKIFGEKINLSNSTGIDSERP